MLSRYQGDKRAGFCGKTGSSLNKCFDPRAEINSVTNFDSHDGVYFETCFEFKYFWV